MYYVSAFKRVKFMSDRMPYIILRGPWYDTVLHVCAPTEDKTDMKDRFSLELKLYLTSMI
jgi:hypothetical protein